jgi:DNA-binding CsgD family transcriptional regulator
VENRFELSFAVAGGKRIDQTRAELLGSVVGSLASGKATVLVGPAGIGKTSLFRQTLKHESIVPFPVRHAVASASAQRFSFGAFAGLVNIESGTIDPVALMSMTIAELRRSKTRTLLVADDAHVLDDQSATLLHHLVVEDAATVFATVRSGTTLPDAVRRLIDDGLANVVHVNAMSDAEVVALAETELGGLLDRATAKRLTATCEGNPLIVLELLRGSQTAGLLTCRGLVWSAEEFVVGSSARELVRDRMRALDDDVLAVARLFAVGGALPKRVALAVCGRTKLGRAQASGIVAEQTHSDVLELAHPLMVEGLRAEVPHAETITILARLMDATSGEPIETKDLVVPRSLWALELSDQPNCDPAILISVANRYVNTAQMGLARRLAEAAVRAGGGAEAEKTLWRASGGLGLPAHSEADVDALFERANGQSEGFILGVVPLEGLFEDLAKTRSALEGDPRADAIEAHEIGTALRIGLPPQGYVPRLLEIAEHAEDRLAKMLAVQILSPLMKESGQSEDWLALVDRVEATSSIDNLNGEPNQFHEVHLGAMRAQCLGQLGDVAGAEREMAKRVWNAFNAESVLAKVIGNCSEAEIALAHGRPNDALRCAGVVLSIVGTLEAGGTGPWAAAATRFASAWAGVETNIPESPMTLTNPCKNYEPQVELFDCYALASRSSLVQARERALALSDRAERDGLNALALNALHLASRIEPTIRLSARATALAQMCQGPLGSAQAQHCEGLATDDGALLEQVGEQFMSMGYLAWAFEAAHIAVESYRRKGMRAAVIRTTKLVETLTKLGVAPSFAIGIGGSIERLSIREIEIARLAAAGETNRSISTLLGLSQRTVESHLQGVYRKVGVNDRAALARALAAAR